MAEEEPPLPPGWEEEVDEEGDKYYISPAGETQWERPDPPLAAPAAADTAADAAAATNPLLRMQGGLQRAATMSGITLPPVDEMEKAPLPKMAALLPKITKKDGVQKEDRPIRGKISMASGNKDQHFVYIPDDLILGEKRDKLTAQKLFSLVELTMPQLIFYVSGGDTTQTWNFRKPNGYDQFLNAKASENDSATNLEHWRSVIRQKLTRTLSNTAKSCNESGAYFCIDSSGYDAIGHYLASGCTKQNKLLSVAHGGTFSGTFHWHDEVMDLIRATYTNGDGVEEVDKEIGIVVKKKDPPIEFNDLWMDGDRLKWTSDELGDECEKLEIERDAYKHNPSSAPTHYIICESPIGRKIVEEILMKHVPSGEFIINGSYVGTAKRVANALQAERPLFIFQHTGGCADLASVMLDQVKNVQRQFAAKEREAKKQGKANDKDRPRLEDLMSINLPFDPFHACDPNWVVGNPPTAGLPKIQFTGIVGNIEAKSQVELMTHINATFANFPSGTNTRARLVIDPFVQRGAELQDLISRTMCSAGDGKNEELNGEFADANRLLLAWEMHGALTLAAEKQEKIGTVLQAMILTLSFATLAIAQLRSNIEYFLGWIPGIAGTTTVPSGDATTVTSGDATTVPSGDATENVRRLSELLGGLTGNIPGTGSIPGTGGIPGTGNIPVNLTNSLGGVTGSLGGVTGGLGNLGGAAGSLGGVTGGLGNLGGAAGSLGGVAGSLGGLGGLLGLGSANGSGVSGNVSITNDLDSCTDTPDSITCQLTYYASIVVPLVVTALLTFKGRFDPDAQVVELRAGAARLETEIYKFRTRTGPYARAALASADAAEGADDEDTGGATGMAARDRFRISITAIKDALLKSVVTEHSMPRPVQGADHTAKLKAEYNIAQKLVGKYMPGQTHDADEEEEVTSKAAKKEAKKLAKDAAKTQAAAAAAMRGELPPGKLMSMITGILPFLKRGTAVMPTPRTMTDKDDDDSGLLTTDSGFGPLSAEEYVRFRTLPKLVGYSQKSPKQAKQVAIFEIAAIALSTGSSLLGAFDNVQPVPLIVQIGSTLGAWVAYRQMKIALKLTNSAVGQLERLVIWWQSLSMIEKRRPDKKEKLITEDVISSAVPELAIRKQMDANDDDDEKK